MPHFEFAKRAVSGIVSSAALGAILTLAIGAAGAEAEVVVVVSAQSPVTELSKNQISDIFLCKTSHYPSGEPAVPVDQSEGSSARDEFYAKFTGKSPAQLRAHWSTIIFTGRGQPPKEVSNGIATKKFLAENPLAIGYIEQTQVDPSVRVLSP